MWPSQLGFRSQGGTVALGGATLRVFPAFSPADSPAEGTQFTIISNDGADAVSGTFAGLARARMMELTPSPSRSASVPDARARQADAAAMSDLELPELTQDAAPESSPKSTLVTAEIGSVPAARSLR